MKNAIEIKNLRKEYKSKKQTGFVLNNITFTLPKGYIMGLIGPNGAGKTTTIKLLMNLIKRDSGEIKLFDQDNKQFEEKVRSRIGFVYDIPSFYDDVKLKTIKSAFSPFYSKWNDDLFHSLISEFKLPLNKKFKKLSHGMKTKFALAIALSHDADLLIMDEPTAGLDPLFRRNLLDRMRDLLQDENKSILFSTHITTDLERIADYITFLNNGEIIFSDKKDNILENWKKIKGDSNLLDQIEKSNIYGIKKNDFGFEAVVSNLNNIEKSISSKLLIDRVNLEDIMISLTNTSSN